MQHFHLNGILGRGNNGGNGSRVTASLPDNDPRFQGFRKASKNSQASDNLAATSVENIIIFYPSFSRQFSIVHFYRQNTDAKLLYPFISIDLLLSHVNHCTTHIILQ
jgi:hypothetical protein